MFWSVTLIFFGWCLNVMCQLKKYLISIEFVCSINELCCKFDKILPTIKHDIYAVFSSSGLEGECHGPTMQYRVCENPSCPAGVPAFRDWQCQAFSVRSSNQKHVHQWQAVIDDGSINHLLRSYQLLIWLIACCYCWLRKIQEKIKKTNEQTPSPRFLVIFT